MKKNIIYAFALMILGAAAFNTFVYPDGPDDTSGFPIYFYSQRGILSVDTESPAAFLQNARGGTECVNKTAAAEELMAKKALDFLIRSIETDQYLQKCSSDTPIKCQVDNKKDVSIIYFALRALPNNQKTEHLKKKLLADLIAIKKKNKWGYSKESPLDADDTASALIALKMEAVLNEYSQILYFYDKGDNAFVTFKNRKETPKRKLTTKMTRNSAGAFDNYMYHPEVNLNVYRLLKLFGRTDLINSRILKSSQKANGAWHSFYYPSEYYSSWLASELFSDMQDYRPYLDKTVDFILNTQNQDGSWGKSDSYDTALALNSLASAGYKGDAFKKGIDFLRFSQLPDGSWHTEQVIWQYLLFVDTEKGHFISRWTSFDSSRVITTSLVLMLLNKLDL